MALAAAQLPSLTTLPTEEVFLALRDPSTRLVTVTTRLTIDDYRRYMSPQDWSTAVALAERLRGKRVVFVNSTMKGGGVVIMRKALIPLLKFLGVDVDWYVLTPNADAFDVTKYSFHCNFQNTGGIKPLTAARKAIYLQWISDEFEALKDMLAAADVFVCDDWQPAGLIPHIRRNGFRCKIAFRDHIQSEGKLMVTPGTTQAASWDFLWHDNMISTVNVFVAHPVASFVPGNVPSSMATLMPATIEPNDDLLREVTDAEMATESAWLNEEFVAHGCTPLDPGLQYNVLVARFDEAKYMDGALRYHARMFRQLRARGYTMGQIPHVVVVGYAATDDPSGLMIRDQILHLRNTKYRKIKDSIHIARIEPRDLALNVLVRKAWLLWQPSIKEGFESRPSDGIWLHVPAIGSTAGGIPLQIQPGLSGFVIDPYDHATWANTVIELFLNEDRHAELRRTTALAARTHTMRFTTGKNAISWMALSVLVLEQPDYNFGLRWADTLAQDALASAA